MKRQGRGGFYGREDSGRKDLEVGEGKHCAGDKLKIAQEVRSPECDREGEPGIIWQERMTGVHLH